MTGGDWLLARLESRGPKGLRETKSDDEEKQQRETIGSDWGGRERAER